MHLMTNGINFDWHRESRTGVPEAVLAEGKTNDALLDILGQTIQRKHALLFTRINAEQAQHLKNNFDVSLDYHPQSSTLVYGNSSPVQSSVSVGVVVAGTSDMPVATEAQRTLGFYGLPNTLYADVGVAGLWRLTSIQGELKTHSILIAIAGMEGALFSVLAGLVQVPVIAVPSSVGYGVSKGGHAALHSALASCSPGIVTVNIDNGYGAAAAARKFLHVRS